MIKEVILLAGGFGTRLSSVVNDVPKPMALVNGKPFLHYLLKQVSETNISKAILAIHHKKEVIIDYFNEKYLGLEIEYSIEEEALGTGGGIRQALELCESDEVLVMNGDSLLDIDLKDFIYRHNHAGTNFSMALKKMPNVDRYGAVEFDENHKLIEFKEKGKKEGEGYINSGIYILNRNYFLERTAEGKFSLENDFFEPLSKEKKIAIAAFDDFFIDIGIPTDFQKAQNEFKRFDN